MAKPFKEWTVLPHGKLVRIDDNILSVSGLIHMPVGEFPRRMTVVRLADERLIIYSAIALDEAEMLALERWGTIAYLIVPNDHHRMDAKIWKDRYPALKVITPPGARADVEEVVHVNAVDVEFGDPHVDYIVVPGTKGLEAALLVRDTHGTTLILNEVIFNVANISGMRGWLMKTLGMTGDEPHMPAVFKMREVDDKEALARQLSDWSRLPDLQRVIVSHGDIIANDAADVLGRIATELRA